MKRVLSILLIMLLLIPLYACGKDDEDHTTSEIPTVSELPTEPETESDTEPVVEPVMGSIDVEKISALSTEKQEFWFGKLDESGFPKIYNDPMRELIEKYDGIVFGHTEKQEITLTFDCGYEYENLTSTILDTLKAKGVHAMFFVTMDYVKGNPDKIKRMIDEGHVVGNHSTSHPDFSQCSIEKMQDEVTQLHDYVKENFGYEMKYFRFPEGSFNEQALAVMQAMGYKPVFWSFAYADWDTSNQKSEADALQAVVNGMHKGAVPLLHAVSKTNDAILGKYIDAMREKGFEFVDTASL